MMIVYGHGEEADRAGAEQQRRHGDERVRRVEVAADQEPGDPGAEVAAAQAPLVEVLQRRRRGASATATKPMPVTSANRTMKIDELDPVDVANDRQRSRCVFAVDDERARPR